VNAFIILFIPLRADYIIESIAARGYTLRLFSKGATMADRAVLTALRKDNTKNAIVFVHGFGGDSSGMWGNFPNFLMETPALDG